MSDLIRRKDAVQACQVGPSDEWSQSTKSGYNQAATDCAMNILRITAVQPDLEAALRETLLDLIREQSEGEWDDETINRDAEMFLVSILTVIANNAHVNKTPKSEHDTANMLTPATKGERDD